MSLRARIDRERSTAGSSGGVIELPARCRDASVAAALFRVDRAAAGRLVESMELVPTGTGAGALAGLAFLDYRDTSLGAYREAGLGVLCRPAGHGSVPAPLQLALPARRRDVGVAVLDLPVTTSASCAAGTEVWAYPKFVGDVPIAFGAGDFDGRVLDPDGGLICSLQGSFGAGTRVPSVDLVSYTHRHGRLRRAEATMAGSFRCHTGRGLRLALGASRHPMRSRLAELGLHDTSPLVFLVRHDLRAILHPPEPV